MGKIGRPRTRDILGPYRHLAVDQDVFDFVKKRKRGKKHRDSDVLREIIEENEAFRLLVGKGKGRIPGI